MPKSKSCSVCCVAMLTNKNFDEAMNLCFDEEPKDFSMSIEAMEAALRRAGLKTTRLESNLTAFKSNTLIECRHNVERYWHYIVYDAEQQAFLDPIPDPPPVDEYKFFRAIKVE